MNTMGMRRRAVERKINTTGANICSSRGGVSSSRGLRSVRAMAAALALCGAMVFGGLGMSSVSAAGVNSSVSVLATGGDETDSSQYIAIGNARQDQGSYNEDSERYEREIDGHTYYYTTVSYGAQTHNYWVRDGYAIELVTNQRWPGASSTMVVNAYKISDEADDGDLLMTYQNVYEETGITTLNGKSLQDTSTGIYAAATNGGGTTVGGTNIFVLTRSDGTTVRETLNKWGFRISEPPF